MIPHVGFMMLPSNMELIAILVLLVIYFSPTIVAFARNKSSKVAILALNLLLGWTFIGWVVALVWALSQDKEPVIVQQISSYHSGEAEKPPNQPSNEVVNPSNQG